MGICKAALSGLKGLGAGCVPHHLTVSIEAEDPRAGSVEQGAVLLPKTSNPGALIGEYEVLSGHPLPADVLGGPSGGVSSVRVLPLWTVASRPPSGPLAATAAPSG